MDYSISPFHLHVPKIKFCFPQQIFTFSTHLPVAFGLLGFFSSHKFDKTSFDR